MSLTAKLALSNLKKKPGRTAFTIIAVVLSVAIVTAVFGFVESSRLTLRDMYISGNGDWHVVFTHTSPEINIELSNDPEVGTYFTRFESSQFCFRLAHPSKDYKQTAAEIAGRHNIPIDEIAYFKELLAIEGFESGGNFIPFVIIGVILASVVMIASVIVISNAFAISAGERLREFGILKSVGASSRQIAATVLYEAFFISLIGIPVGLLAGCFVELVGVSVARYFLEALNAMNNNQINFRFAMSAWVIAVGSGLSVITILLSAFIPARRASKRSAISSIRAEQEVKINPKKIKTSPIIKRIFGIEGVLADKQLKRSRRAYRSTVVSLTISVILFIVANGATSSMLSSSAILYPEMNANITLRSTEVIDSDKISEIAKFVTETDGGTVNFVGETRLKTPDDFMSQKYKEIIADAGGYTNGVTLISLSEKLYNEVAKEAGVNNGGAILINAAPSAYGNHAAYRPYDIIPNFIAAYDENGSFDIPISGSALKIPSEVQVGLNPRNINIAVPENYITANNLIFNTGGWFVLANDAELFVSNATETNLYEKLGIEKSRFFIENRRKNAEAINGLARLVTVFAYSFVGLLTLIALTNVISTISTNIRMRAREFAVLQSIGETRAGIRRMLSLESLLWSVKSLVYGLVIGLILFYLIYRLASGTVPYPFEFPVLAVVECIAAVFAVSVITMLCAVSKLGKGSIIEDIRADSF
jgi:putative ABC transport system permease protein